MKTITRLLTAIASLLLLAEVNAQCVAGFTEVQTSPNVIAFTNTSQPIIQNSTWFMWDFGDQQTDYAQDPIHTYSVPGTYIACLMMVDSLSGCQATFCDTVTVTGNLLCNVSVSISTIATPSCATCNDGMLAAYPSGGTAPYTYMWSNNSTLQSLSGVAPGNYSVCVIDANGCMSCDSITLSYQSGCSAAFTWTQTAPNVISFTNTSTPINPATTNFYWYMGDNTYDYTQDPTHTYSAGTYYVCVTMYDSMAACQSTFCDSIVVTGSILCNGSVNGYMITPASCSSCADGSAGVNVYNMTAPYTYAWSNGATSATISGVLPGTYSVCVTDANGCVACGTVSVIVGSQSCSANFSVYLDSVNTNQAWIYNLSTGSPMMQYQWSWGDNTPNDTLAYPQHVYTQTGTYTICLIVVDQALGCTDTMCQSLFVARFAQSAQSVPFYVNVVAPLGIDSPDAGAMWSLFPNPAHDEITVNMSQLNGENFYSVTDMSGRIVNQGPLVNARIDISALDKGAYFLSVTEKDGTVSTKMFIRN